MRETIVQIIHWIGSAMPLSILCLMLAMLRSKKKVKDKTVYSYCALAVVMFLILLRT